MMKPIFFPSTWMPRSAREVLLACFKQVTVLQPALKLVPDDLRRLEESGRLEILLPDENSVEVLPDLLKAYHAWADLHEGEPPDFYRFAKLAAPAPDDASTEWIRARIRDSEGDSTNAQDTPGRERPDPILLARLFLAIAQEFDQQNESLHRDLDDIAAMERNMFQSLSPDERPQAFIATGKSLPMGFGIDGSQSERRLASWLRLYVNCRETTIDPTPPPSLFVTDDPEALRLMLPPEEAPEVVCRITGIPPTGEDKPFAASAVHRDIDETLQSAANGVSLSSPAEYCLGGQATPGENIGALTFYRIKACTAPAPFDREDSPEKGAETPYSLLGLIEKKLYA